ncbi:MAG: hypothetical protein AAFW98_11730, partial [Pseudomonadota bacterium]
RHTRKHHQLRVHRRTRHPVHRQPPPPDHLARTPRHARHLLEHPPFEALAAYDEERRTKTAEIVTLNRKGGPERVIDVVSERAPDGFDNLDDVATQEELTAIVRGYAGTAGYSKEKLAGRPSPVV